MSDETQTKMLALLYMISVEVAASRGDIGRLDAKVSSLDAKVTSLDAKVTGLEVKVDRLDTRLSRLETRVEGIETDILDFRDEFERRVSPLER